MTVVGPVWILAAVLVVSGVVKLTDPASAAPGLRALRLPAGPVAAVLLGLVEITIGAMAVALGGVAATVALGVWYLLLALSVLVLLRRGAASCGCFGAGSAPPTALHVVLNAVAGAAALGAAATVPPAAVEVWDELGALTLVLIGFVGTGTALLVAAFELLPRVTTAGVAPTVPTFEVRAS